LCNNSYDSVAQAAVSNLKQEYKEGETTLKNAMTLAIKVLSKTLDMTKLTAEKGNLHLQKSTDQILRSACIARHNLGYKMACTSKCEILRKNNFITYQDEIFGHNSPAQT
jgi:hypothetical protein